MEPFVYRETAGVPLLVLEEWEREFPRLTVGFTARKRGEDENCRNYALHVGDAPEQTLENRRKLALLLGMSEDAWTCGEQVHGVQIVEVTRSERGRGKDSRTTAFPDTDGMFTAEPGVLLASYYADCVPLYFWAPDVQIVGVAHAGWKGTVGGIARRMVDKLAGRGVDPGRLRVAIGPSVGPCCYEVDERVIRPLEDMLGDLTGVAEATLPGKWQLDLKRANREILIRTGIRPEHVLTSGWCTCCHDAHFYSHRRDKGKTGRMTAWIGIRESGC
ncbi:peptidoglycan editing factor PgeF [Staphylospora marina]|uniref:peptidoglycan editing factor PgeF n=1 Tax=Staphylospora marina TaxID=2490858 RepID=UPI000F5BFF90|nr:peptidoglycan editing factor PgeF [Staphylospora marina]